jgi:hypothetical protein
MIPKFNMQKVHRVLHNAIGRAYGISPPKDDIAKFGTHLGLLEAWNTRGRGQKEEEKTSENPRDLFDYDSIFNSVSNIFQDYQNFDQYPEEDEPGLRRTLTQKLVGQVGKKHVDQVVNDLIEDHRPQSLKNMQAYESYLRTNVYTPVENEFLDNWTEHFEVTNSYLFGGLENYKNQPFYYEPKLKEAKNNVSILDGILNKSILPQDVVSYRGMDVSKCQITFPKGFETGDKFEYKGFMATALDKSWALDFVHGDNTYKNKNMLFEIHANKGIHATYMDKNSIMNIRERELLIERNTKWKVISTRNEKWKSYDVNVIVISPLEEDK